MRVTSLAVKDFRNLEVVQFEPHPGLNLLIGSNGQGKTSILESIYLLANDASFRPARDKDLIKIGKSSYSIKANYENNSLEKSIEIDYVLNQRKIIKINGKKTFSHLDRPKIVMFNPDDLFLVKGPPQNRRLFIDYTLKQVSKEFTELSLRFDQILKRRNSILKSEKVSLELLEAVDTVFTDLASQIILARLNWIQQLEKEIISYFIKLGGNQSIRLTYAMSFPIDSGKLNHSLIRQALLDHIKSQKSQETARRTSLFGPHRDDINIYLNNLNARLFASQGQQRSIAIALKFAELQTAQTMHNSYPVFLLDEVVAELDNINRKKILELLTEESFQVFLASVDISLFNESSGKIIKVQDGGLVN
ncbi:MAG: DNA replication/repair protein RecF [Chitinophagales bacterium]